MHPMDYAMQIEQEGKAYYLKQASLMEDSGFREVFERLAEEEEKHYQLLKQVKGSGVYETVASTTVERAKEFFANSVKDPNYIAIYEQAIALEEKTLDFYRKMAQEATSEREREAFMFLQREEQGHRDLLERTLQWLKSPEEQYPYI